MTSTPKISIWAYLPDYGGKTGFGMVRYILMEICTEPPTTREKCTEPPPMIKMIYTYGP